MVLKWGCLQYIRQKDNGQLELRLNWLFWLLDWLPTALVSFCLGAVGLAAFIGSFTFVFFNQYSVLLIPVGLIMFFLCTVLAAYLSASSLTIGKIRKTRKLLAKYADKINEDVSDKFIS